MGGADVGSGGAGGRPAPAGPSPRWSAREAIAVVTDDFSEFAAPEAERAEWSAASAPGAEPAAMVPYDNGPLGWDGYGSARQRARERTGESESVVCGTARVAGVETVLVSFEFGFLGGSLGERTGDRLVSAWDRARELRLPVVSLIATGGSRMQEGMRALTQLQRVAGRSALNRAARLPQIAVLRDPTTGGGWATLGAGADVVLALPGAQVGFAGSRVRPADADPYAYSAEGQVAAGQADAVVPPDEVRTVLGRWLRLLSPGGDGAAAGVVSPYGAAAADVSPRAATAADATAGATTGATAGQDVAAGAAAAGAVPAATEPAGAAPGAAGPAGAAPAATDPTEAALASTDPAGVAPAATNPTEAAPASANPAGAAPGAADPAGVVPGAALPVTADAPPPYALGTAELPASGWEAVRSARDARRPRAVAYLEAYFDWREEISGDRCGGTDSGIRCGFGRHDGRTVAFAAQCGTAVRPAGFRTAARLIRLADRLGIPVLTLIDTPGAANDAAAERAGAGAAIADVFAALASVRTPVTSLLIGEGGSGGALALAAPGRLWATPDSYFSVIAPEAAAAILKRDADAVRDTADQLRIRPQDLLELGLIQGIVPPPASQ
ncbi:carboxyl transferase domain-containing protein [Streptomyces paromomycinus]|uniref:carboxyl transferase domain-containing protein n=1 Tax=Streptomyces paromomycinus TaxID=92743 RepID=UPI000F6181CB